MKLAVLALSLFALWLLIVWHLSSPTVPHRVGKPVGAVGATLTEPHPASLEPRTPLREASRSRAAVPGVVTGTLTDTTAYCTSGSPTASGAWPREGMAASNTYPFGTRLHVETVGIVTVADRIGHGTELDIYEDSCSAARLFGRRSLHVTVTR